MEKNLEINEEGFTPQERSPSNFNFFFVFVCLFAGESTGCVRVGTVTHLNIMVSHMFVVTYTIGMSSLDYFREVIDRTFSVWILEDDTCNISIRKVCCKHISYFNCKSK